MFSNILKVLVLTIGLFISIISPTHAFLDIESVGNRVFNSALQNINPIGSKLAAPSADIIFMNFKINPSVYSECRGKAEEFINYYNELQKINLFSNLSYSKNPDLQFKARANLLGILVCVEVSSQYLIFEPIEPFTKLKAQILSLNQVPTSYGLGSSRNDLFHEITWRILLNHYLNGDDFSHSMFLSMVQMYSWSKEFNNDEVWLSRIYTDLVLQYMEIDKDIRGSSRMILSKHISDAINVSFKTGNYDVAKKILFLDNSLKFLDKDENKNLSEKLYFLERSKQENIIKLSVKKASLAIAHMSLLGKLYILIFIYMFGLGIKLKQEKTFNLKKLKSKDGIEVIFHPFAYYFINNQNAIYRIVHTLFIFFLFSIMTDFVSFIESDITKNIYWFGF